MSTLPLRRDVEDSSRSAFYSPVKRSELKNLPRWCDADAAQEPRRFLSLFPHSHATPLLRFDGLANQLGLKSILVKDETGRFNLSSFKALGGASAVFRLGHRFAEGKLDRALLPTDLTSPNVRAALASLTVCCASDGNHGRSVAFGARIIGASCKVFLHAGVTDERVSHIERQGASIVRVDGSYDDSVAAAHRAAAENGWLLVPDIAVTGDSESEATCAMVMQGYSILVEEILQQLADKELAPTHVFIQAGVGGLAGAVFGYWSARVDDAPKFVVVEPDRAACLFESAKAGQPVSIPAGEATIMAMLECQTPSVVAWPVIEATATTYALINDDEARAAVRRLAWPIANDPVLEVGESGAAGLAGLIKACAHLGSVEGLGPDSVVLVIATEGPTDHASWSGSYSA